eukprot:75777-Pelagomonas_calceolata.AAC.1
MAHITDIHIREGRLRGFRLTAIMAPSCWTAQILDSFQGSRRCESFVTAVKQGTPISLQDFSDDLRHRLHGAWRAVEGVNPRRTNNKLATYQAFFALPFDQNVRKPIQLPGHLHLELPQHVMQNVSRFSLRAPTLNVETASWEDGISPMYEKRKENLRRQRELSLHQLRKRRHSGSEEP